MRSSLVVAAGLLAGLSWSSLLVAAPVSSISQYGVTWTFDKAYEAGQFVTGDWWVVGPVTITSVSPAPTGTRHGSALNPRGGRQGYDSRGGEYAATDNVSFPRSLQADQSLVSSVSKVEGAEIKNVGALQSQAVLTVVPRPQPAGSLRPSYAGTYKKYFNLAQVAAPAVAQKIAATPRVPWTLARITEIVAPATAGSDRCSPRSCSSRKPYGSMTPISITWIAG
jgi:hypothetical protein